MLQRKFYTCLFYVLLFQSASARESTELTVEMSRVKLTFMLDDMGAPAYAVYFNQKPVILPSHLGFVLNEDSVFYNNFELTGTEKKTVDDTWQPVWGETKNIRNHYEQVTVHLRQKRSPAKLLDIVFRVFEDGVGFRYE